MARLDARDGLPARWVQTGHALRHPPDEPSSRRTPPHRPRHLCRIADRFPAAARPAVCGRMGRSFAHAGQDLWRNVAAIFTGERMQWGGLVQFWHDIYVPYFIGALLPGIVLSLIGYYITIPIVQAYQKARHAKADDRRERRRKLKQHLAEAAARLKHKTEHDDKPDAS